MVFISEGRPGQVLCTLLFFGREPMFPRHRPPFSHTHTQMCARTRALTTPPHTTTDTLKNDTTHICTRASLHRHRRCTDTKRPPNKKRRGPEIVNDTHTRAGTCTPPPNNLPCGGALPGPAFNPHFCPSKGPGGRDQPLQKQQN